MKRLRRHSWALLALGVFLVSLTSTLMIRPSPPPVVGVVGKVDDSHFSAEILSNVSQTPTLDFRTAFEFIDTDISALLVLVADLATLTPLYSKSATVSAEPASLSKLVTAMVALKSWPEDRSLIVPANCLGLAGDNMGLMAGEVISLKNLLYGMLLDSDTDATCVIYSNVGGIGVFATEMNNYVATLGLTSTRFGNPVGFDGADGWEGNTTTANDLAVIAREALKNPILKNIVGTKNITVTSIDGKQAHVLTNTNELLGSLGVFGLKTGTTNLAGQCLITAVSYNGRDFLLVVLGSSDRYSDTRKLIQWLQSAVSWSY